VVFLGYPKNVTRANPLSIISERRSAHPLLGQQLLDHRHVMHPYERTMWWQGIDERFLEGCEVLQEIFLQTSRTEWRWAPVPEGVIRSPKMMTVAYVQEWDATRVCIFV